MPATTPIDAAVVTKIIAHVVRKESRAGQSLDLLRAEVIDGKRVNVKAKEGTTPCKTASWSFVKRGTPNVLPSATGHEIIIDKDFRETLEKRPHVRAQCVRYVAEMMKHEVAHARHTDRDIPALAADLAALGIEFALFNIAEDVRIESLDRAHVGGWCWTGFYSDRYVKHPAAALLTRKTRNGREFPSSWYRGKAQTVQRSRAKVLDTETKTVDVLNEFYREMEAAATSRDLLPICVDFVDTFKMASDDIATSPDLSDRERRRITAGFGRGTGPGTAEGRTDYSGGVTKRGVSVGAPGTLRDFLSAADEVLKMSDADYKGDVASGSAIPAITAQWETLAREYGAKVEVGQSGSRVHIPGLAGGNPGAFRRTIEGAAPNVVVLFDQSRSMNRQYVDHGGGFAAALQAASQSGAVDATLILTGGGRSVIIPRSMPSRHLLRFIPKQGCESVDKTLNRHAQAVKDSDVVIVYTDGHLTDGDVDAAQWRSRGVDLIGVAVAHEDETEKMRSLMVRHFGRVLLAKDGTELAQKIVQYVANR